MDIFFVLPEHANNLVIQFDFLLLVSCNLGRSNIPQPSSIIFAAARGNPGTIWCPTYATDLFLVLFYDVFQFYFVILTRAKRTLRPFTHITVVLVYGPDEYLSILAHRGQFVTLIIEFAEPDLFFVLSERHRTIGRQ